jgi:hypothetical protein
VFFDREFNYPRRWSEMSLDWKAFFVSFFAIMLMFMAGGALSTWVELGVEAALVVILAAVMIWQRLTDGWRWAGAGLPQFLDAALCTLAIGAFLVAALVMQPPFTPAMLPWYLGIANIGVFNLLIALRLARPSRAAYEHDCRPAEAQRIDIVPPRDLVAPSEAPPHRTIRITFQIAFFCVWLAGVTLFFSEGAMHPSPESLRQFPFLAEAIKDLSFLQAPTVHMALLVLCFVGMPSVLFAGFYLQNIAGIQVLPGLPARRVLDRRP